MPVPTDTFWNIRKLNVVFAVTAVGLLASVAWFVVADHHKPWRGYQQQARVWETAMTEDAQRRALTAQERQELETLRKEKDRLEREFKHSPVLTQLQKDRDAKQAQMDAADLPMRTVKGEITPLVQQLEKARLEFGDEAEQTRAAAKSLKGTQEEYNRRFEQFTRLERERNELDARIAAEKAELDKKQKRIADLERESIALEEKLKTVHPTGAAALGEIIRNAPLSQWFNPSEKVQQVVVPDVRTDLNFLTVETIDRCQTCHVNIDNPRYEETTFVRFVEGQIATSEGQDVGNVSRPVVLLDFWVNAIKARIDGHADGSHALSEGFTAAGAEAMQRANEVLARTEATPIASVDELPARFAEMAETAPPTPKEGDPITAAQWHDPIAYYRADLENLLRGGLDKKAFDALRELYRQALIAEYNRTRSEENQPELSANRVLLAHPRLDLFVEPESKHPMKTMGCTVCHEGSGQEAEFVHTVHTPRPIWVDEETGAPVPAFLIKEDHHARAQPAAAHAGVSLDGARVALAANAPASHAAVTTHHDVKLTDPHDPAPFAPDPGLHGQSTSYVNPANPGQPRRAIKQEEYWARHYAWEEVHYMHWERPMHDLDFVESSCNRCHSEIFDIKEEAPVLFQGRRLFSQLGCANCHSIDQLHDDLDIKKVGPSLAHVDKKLSPQMIASWIWSPKAFRPTTRMPHFFMLENNSSPVDILRTRTETAAITYYLTTQKPQAASASAEYAPEPPPQATGDPAKGHEIFRTVGCMSCHTNLADYGKQWIVEDLVKRTGATQKDAIEQFDKMSYNQQHWYALEHLKNKLSLVGPELSGVGTKLTAGRDEATAETEARAWLYDWLRNPRHYSSYTIMPNFRLTEQEANDLAAYLLTLKRPDYEAVDFYEEVKSGAGAAMLNELCATLVSGQVSLEYARGIIAGKNPDATGKTVAWTPEEKLMFLGDKMIRHYGCNGCHQINGLEDAASACANLDEWGLKDPHKLDFGYFDHAFDADREKPIEVHKVAHEGLTPDAPRIDGGSDKLAPVSVAWEHMHLERRPWLYNKLHNTRVYDRGRTTLESELATPEGIVQAIEDNRPNVVGKPYDKLKMPKFFLTDEEVKSIVTFVTAVRKPLVSDAMRAATYSDAKMRAVKGQQLATMFNCYGCHNIEGNDVHLHQYLDVWNPNGTKDPARLNDFAPPRLVGEGARVQPAWLHGFLRNVRPIRPWLATRMPSFAVADTVSLPGGGQTDAATKLVDYFAGHTQLLYQGLDAHLKPIEAYRKSIAGQPNEADWFQTQSSTVRPHIDWLQRFALASDLTRVIDIDPRQNTIEDLRDRWSQILYQAQFLRDTWAISYPYPSPPTMAAGEEDFRRGEALFNSASLDCKKCHTLGDDDLLAKLATLEPPKTQPAAAVEEEEDPYGEAEPAAPAAGASAAAEEEDPYGEADTPPAAAEVLGPPLLKPTVPGVTLGGAGFGPNLINVHRRINYNWAQHWVRDTQVIMPGTRMPAFWPARKDDAGRWSHPPLFQENERAVYGHTTEDQIRYLLAFVYSAGERRYTPGSEKLAGLPAPAPVELRPLTAPPPPPATGGEVPAPGGTANPSPTNPPDGGTTEPGPTAPAATAETPAPTPQPEAAVSIIELPEGPSSPSEITRIAGEVKLEGAPARRRPIPALENDAYCGKAHKGPALDERFIVDADKNVRNVFVYVKSGLPTGRKYDAPAPALIDQVGCQYTPHVLGVMTGQTLKIGNSDNAAHNVNAQPRTNTPFNFSSPPRSVETKRFSKPELRVLFKCDVHPWMNAMVHVVPHPFFAVTDAQGRYELKDLPPGTYTLELVHESPDVPPAEIKDVRVEAGTAARADAVLTRQRN